MPKLPSPCLDCGTVTPGTRCPECEDARNKVRAARNTPHAPKPSATARGYDAAWKKLSRRARLLQPFCSDCGATEDLQADHLPQAWARKARGLPIRLKDIDVVCGACNRKRGAARGETPRNVSKPLSVIDPNPISKMQF